MTYKVGERYQLRNENSTNLAFITVCIIVLAVLHYKISKLDILVGNQNLILDKLSKASSKIELSIKLGNDLKERLISQNKSLSCEKKDNKIKVSPKPSVTQSTDKTTKATTTKVNTELNIQKAITKVT